MRRRAMCILLDSYTDITFHAPDVCSKCHELYAIYSKRDAIDIQKEWLRISDWGEEPEKAIQLHCPADRWKRRSCPTVLALNPDNGLKTGPRPRLLL